MTSTRRIKHWTQILVLALLLAEMGSAAHAARYRVGDTVTNFTFVARKEFMRPDGTVAPAGSAVHLSDFEGRIVFLEWFAVWCPYCVAAAPQVDAGIAKWYAARNGNPHGVPVIHVAVNQEAASFYQAQTTTFVAKQGFGVTVNDYDTTGTNKVRFLFQSTGQPIFAVINGVTNSPSHKPWELLVNHLGYGDTDFNTELAAFRALIDQVQPASVALLLSEAHIFGSSFEFSLQTQPGRSYRVQSASILNEWTTLATFKGTNTLITFRDTNAPQSERFYRVLSP